MIYVGIFKKNASKIDDAEPNRWPIAQILSAR